MPFGNLEPIPRKDKINVAYLVQKLQERVDIELKPIAGTAHAENRFVTEADLHRPGLAIAGYVKLFTFQRIQVIGNTESQYLDNMTLDEQVESFGKLTGFEIPVIFLTDNNTLPGELIEMADKAGIPVYGTPVETTRFMYLIRDFLEDQFAMQSLIHGTMVDVYGIGILIAGKSGIGKSEVALDLVERGHRLVADDVVMLTKKNNILMTAATEMNQHFMEIRGLGIVDVMSMFGIRAIRYQKRLEVVLELSLWDESLNIERTGLDQDSTEILGINIPLVHLPITPGKNITVIAEVIAMNHLLSHYGYDAAEVLQEKIKQHIARKKNISDMPRRAVEYFEGDIE